MRFYLTAYIIFELWKITSLTDILMHMRNLSSFRKIIIEHDLPLNDCNINRRLKPKLYNGFLELPPAA